MSSYRAQGILAAGLGVLAAGATFVACSDPELTTNLRPEGPPEVLAVLVINANMDEQATYCAPGDDKVPTIITGGCGPGFGFECCVGCLGICPRVGEDEADVQDAVANAEPLNWWARVVFDELLDPDVEYLTDSMSGGPCTDQSITCDGHIDTTNPVTLECNGVAVAYDGFYDPTGNAVTLPPGPSIVVYPLDFVPTSAECTLSVNANVVDKGGEPVDSSDYTWTIAELAVVAVSPEDMTEITPTTEFAVSFNSLIDAASVDADDITLTDADGNDVAFTFVADGTDIIITPSAELPAGDYTLTVAAGADFADIGGGATTTADAVTVTVTVPAA